MVSLYASDLGASPAMIGVLTSLFAMSALVIAVPVGRWIDTHGARNVIKIGLSSLFAGFMVIAFGQSVPAILIGQGLSGVGFVLVVLATQSALANEGEAEDHSRNYSTLMTVTSAAHLIGPVSFGYMSDHWGFSLAFYAAMVSAAMALAIVPLIFSKSADGIRQANALGGLGQVRLGKRALELMKDPVLSGAIITGALVQFSQDSMITFFPLYAKGLGMSATTTGAILSARAVALLVVRPLLPMIVQRWSKAQVLGHALFWGGLSIISMGFLTSFQALVVAAVAAGATIGLCQPITIAAVAEYAPADSRGLAFSLRTSGNRVGQTISPLFLGLFAGPIGAAAALWIGGGVMTSGALLVWRRWQSIAPSQNRAADD